MKKPWPSDSILIVAAPTGQSTAPDGADVRFETCTDCGVELTAAQRTYDMALANPARDGRPLKYVCWECAAQYDVFTADEVHDMRSGQDERLL